MSLTATADRMESLAENLQWGYARMPRPVLKAKGLSFRAKCLYCLLLDYARDKAFCFPGQEQLAADLDTSVDTIQRGLNELRVYGLIEWQPSGYNQTNVYTMRSMADTALPGLVRQGAARPPLPAPAECQQTPHPCAAAPHTCGSVAPQPCGSNESKTKEKQERNNSSESLKKGEVLGTHAAYSHEAMTTGNPTPEQKVDTTTATQPDRNTAKQQKPVLPQQKPLPCIGKPLTQDEINEKKQRGLNASGISPLSHIIPLDHWQTLEQQARKAPIKASTSHFSVCTKNAPMFIDATMEEFSLLLGDDPGNTAQNINRAAKLYRQTGQAEETFRERLYEAFDHAKRYPSEAIKKKRKDGRPNRMPLFFTLLAKQLEA
jgi:Helix-turn-helix domain